MNKIENAFDRIMSFESLEKAYRNARKQKRYRPEILEFANSLDENLNLIHDRVINGTFRFGPYRRHWVYVPKKRIVMALPFESRIVQWAVYQELMAFYDRLMIEDSYACRLDGGALRAAKRLQYWMRHCESNPNHEWYIVKLDISKFFYRVDHDVLKKILRRRIADERLWNLIEKIIDSDGEKFGLPRWKSAEEVDDDEWLQDVGMPIGNLTSQLFANIYLNELDQFCKHILHVHMFDRYMDDVILIAESKEQANYYLARIAEFLMEELHLDLNKKTVVKPLGKVEFVGYIVSSTGLKLRKQTVMRIKKSFHEICREYFAGEMDKGQFDRRVASYSGLIKECKNDNLKKRLNEIYLFEKKKAA